MQNARCKALELWYVFSCLIAFLLGIETATKTPPSTTIIHHHHHHHHHHHQQQQQQLQQLLLYCAYHPGLRCICHVPDRTDEGYGLECVRSFFRWSDPKGWHFFSATVVRYKPFTNSWTSRLVQPKNLRFKDWRLRVNQAVPGNCNLFNLFNLFFWDKLWATVFLTNWDDGPKTFQTWNGCFWK